MRGRIVVVVILILGPCCACSHTHARHALDKLQDMHRSISDDLLGIRKDYPPSQPKVYSALDAMGRAIALAKDIHQKRRDYKRKWREEQARVQDVSAKMEQIAMRLKTTQQELDAQRSQNASLVREHRAEVDSLRSSNQQQTTLRPKDSAAREATSNDVTDVKRLASGIQELLGASSRTQSAQNADGGAAKASQSAS